MRNSKCWENVGNEKPQSIDKQQIGVSISDPDRSEFKLFRGFYQNQNFNAERIRTVLNQYFLLSLHRVPRNL